MKELGKKIRSRGWCEFMGLDEVQCSNKMVWSHIVPRYFKLLADKEENSLCLCQNHEKFYYKQQDKFAKMVKKYYPKQYEYVIKWNPWMGKKLRERFI